MTNILLFDSSRSTCDCRSHLLTQITNGSRTLFASTPSGNGKTEPSSYYSFPNDNLYAGSLT